MTQTQTPVSATTAIADPQSPLRNETGEMLLERARELGPLIRKHAAESERERRLAKPVMDALLKAGMQSLFAPRSLGGFELDPVSVARIVEELASADSAAGWSLQSGNVNVWWAARLSEAGVQEIYGSNPGTMTAAAFHPQQRATEVPGGYRVAGRAPLASMVNDTEWVLISAFVMDDGKPRMTEFGPFIVALIIPRREVEIIDTWHTLGMRGTDSNDVAVKDVFVPKDRTFVMTPEFEPGRHFQGRLYRFPASTLVGLFGASVLLAIARNAIDAFRELAISKVPMGSQKTVRDRGTVQASFARAEANLRSARLFFHETLGTAWAHTQAGSPISMEERGDLLLACVHAAQTASEVTEVMHRLAGSTGIYAVNPIERAFRDAHTLRHHAFVSESKLETVGQVHLGLPPEFPLIVF